MTIEKCLMGICIELAPIDASAPKFFGFSEFLTSLALMVLAWTTSDVRYRFRIDCAPIPLKDITFWVVAIVGMLTLLTDLWRAEQRLFPTSISLTFWQAIMGGAILLTFLVWASFAFLFPAIYNKCNSEKFYHTLYLYIMNGSSNELAVIADEIIHSTKNIIHYATDKNTEPNHKNKKNLNAARYANNILTLIASRKFCRAIINNSSTTALMLFQEIIRTKKYYIPIGFFTNNLVCEAIENENSFLYQEINPIDSGLIGFHKPLSQALFSNYEMTNEIETTLTSETLDGNKWNNRQLEAYLRIVLMTLDSFTPEKHGAFSPVLSHALWNITRSTDNIYTLNSPPSFPEQNAQFERFRLVGKFIDDGIISINKKILPEHIDSHIDTESIKHNIDIYGHISVLMFNLIMKTSNITHPYWRTKLEVEIMSHASIFELEKERNAKMVVQRKFTRLLLNNMNKLKKESIHEPARIVNTLLSIVATSTLEDIVNVRDSLLSRLVVRWVKNNYDFIYTSNREVAEQCLGENMEYDKETSGSIIIYSRLQKSGKRHICIKVNPAPALPCSIPDNPKWS